MVTESPQRPVPRARIRVYADDIRLLYTILYEERGRLIAKKIATREADGDTSVLREELTVLKRLMEETERALRDLGITDA